MPTPLAAAPARIASWISSRRSCASFRMLSSCPRISTRLCASRSSVTRPMRRSLPYCIAVYAARPRIRFWSYRYASFCAEFWMSGQRSNYRYTYAELLVLLISSCYCCCCYRYRFWFRLCSAFSSSLSRCSISSRVISPAFRPY